MEARYMTDLEWRICHAVNIYLYRNGKDGETPILVHIPPAKKKNMRSVMSVIQDRVKFAVGFSAYLYKMDGKRVRHPCELEMYNNYVVASNYDKHFKCAQYGRKRSPLLVLNRESKHIRVLRQHHLNYYEWSLKKKAAGEERPQFLYPTFYTNENARPQDLPVGQLGNFVPPGAIMPPGCCVNGERMPKEGRHSQQRQSGSQPGDGQPGGGQSFAGQGQPGAGQSFASQGQPGVGQSFAAQGQPGVGQSFAGQGQPGGGGQPPYGAQQMEQQLQQYNGPPPQGMAPQGMAPQGMAPQGMAPQGMAPQGMAPQGMAPQGMAPPRAYPCIIQTDLSAEEAFRSYQEQSTFLKEEGIMTETLGSNSHDWSKQVHGKRRSKKERQPKLRESDILNVNTITDDEDENGNFEDDGSDVSSESILDTDCLGGKYQDLLKQYKRKLKKQALSELQSSFSSIHLSRSRSRLRFKPRRGLKPVLANMGILTRSSCLMGRGEEEDDNEQIIVLPPPPVEFRDGIIPRRGSIYSFTPTQL